MKKLSSIATDSGSITWNKVSLPSPCVDGEGKSTFIAVRKGSSNNVLVYLEGGGACLDYTSCGSMLSGGSVTTLSPSYSNVSLLYSSGIFATSNTSNPFRTWTIVFVPYGHGDLHMGNRVVKYTSGLSSKTVYHTGYVNAIVAMRWIAGQGTWNKVAVAGSSAGGYGTILHSYSMYQIFNKQVFTIDDAGPGLVASSSGSMQNDEAGNRWGSWQNYPAGAIGDTSKALLYFAEYTLKQCPTCYFGLYEDQQDSTISSFENLSGAEHRAQLLSVSSDIDSRNESRFCMYFPNATNHTVLGSSRFYSTQVGGAYPYGWVNNILNGVCQDYIQ